MTWSVIGIVFILCFYESLFAADTITLTVEANTTVTKKQAVISLLVRNSGNAPALELSPSVMLDNKRFSFPVQKALYPGALYQEKLLLDLGEMDFANLFAPLEVKYVDSTNHPASSLLAVEIRNSNYRKPALTLHLQPIILTQQCVTSELAISNQSSQTIKTKLQLLVPSFITTEITPDTIHVPTNEEMKAEVLICSNMTDFRGTFSYYALATTNRATEPASIMESATLTLDQPGFLARIFIKKIFIYIIIAIAISTLLILGLLQRFKDK